MVALTRLLTLYVAFCAQNISGWERSCQRGWLTPRGPARVSLHSLPRTLILPTSSHQGTWLAFYQSVANEGRYRKPSVCVRARFSVCPAGGAACLRVAKSRGGKPGGEPQTTALKPTLLAHGPRSSYLCLLWLFPGLLHAFLRSTALKHSLSSSTDPPRGKGGPPQLPCPAEARGSVRDGGRRVGLLGEGCHHSPSPGDGGSLGRGLGRGGSKLSRVCRCAA